MAKPKEASSSINTLGEILKNLEENKHFIFHHLTRDKTKDHGFIDNFQTALFEELNKRKFANYNWDKEYKPLKRNVKDSCDIYGSSRDGICIFEIDAARGDQVAKKFLSRMALWGLNPKKPLYYIALLYPSTQKQGKPECEKFVGYSNDILKQINKKSSVIGIYLDVDKGNQKINKIELWDYNLQSRFKISTNIKGRKREAFADGMTASAKEAIKKYNEKKNIKSFEQLSQVFNVQDQITIVSQSYTSCYAKKSIILNNKHVYVYNQWRESRNQANWDSFVAICNDIKITIERQFLVLKNNRFDY